MPKEEAAEILDPETSRNALWKYEGEEQRLEACNEACRIASAALRAQKTPLDRSRWEGCTHCDVCCCCTCKYSITPGNYVPCRECEIGSMYDPQDYCPNCGRPLTEEAWAELERRINDGTTYI